MLTVKMRIDREAAIKRGLAREGDVVIQLDDHHVAKLTDAEREFLVSRLLNTSGRGTDRSFVYVDADGLVSWIKAECARVAEENIAKEREQARLRAALLERVRAVLDGDKPTNILRDRGYTDALRGYGYARVEYLDGDPIPWTHPDFAELAERAQALCKRRNVERQKELQAEVAREVAKREADAEAKAEAEATREDAVATYIPNSMQARFADGYMSEDEQKQHVREALFKPFESSILLSRYVRLKPSDVEHDDECINPHVQFDTEDCATLDQSQYEQYVETVGVAKDVFGDAATVEPVLHVGKCRSCGNVAARTSLLVTLEWHGWTLSREYAL